jgi:hypothetical protein
MRKLAKHIATAIVFAALLLLVLWYLAGWNQ